MTTLLHDSDLGASNVEAAAEPATTPTRQSRRGRRTACLLATAAVLAGAAAGSAYTPNAASSRPINSAVSVTTSTTEAVGSSSALGSQLGKAVAVAPPALARIRTAATHAVSGSTSTREATTYDSNWAGMSLYNRHVNTFQGVSGQWWVPAVGASTANKYSSTWVGVDGNRTRQLIQTGTEGDSVGGRTIYRAWWEILPAHETVITYTDGRPVPVAPGDLMWGYVVKTATPDIWKIHLQNMTRNWSFQSTFSYRGPGVSADWIQEASKVNGVIGTPPAFSPAVFTDLQVAVGGTWYYTRLTSAADGVAIAVGGHVYAAPSEPTNTAPQRFSVTYRS